MGRKGGGRKAFLKSAKPAEEDGEDLQAVEKAAMPLREDGKGQTVEDDPSTKFLHTGRATQNAGDSAETKGESTSIKASAESVDPSVDQEAQDETRGQLTQRHKKVKMAPGRLSHGLKQCGCSYFPTSALRVVPLHDRSL